MRPAAASVATSGAPTYAGEPPAQIMARDWHDFLTPVETVEVDALQKNAERLDRQRRALTQHLGVLRHRASWRRKAAAKRARAASERPVKHLGRRR